MAVSFDTLKPIRCRASIIRKQWENNVQKWQSVNQGTTLRYDQRAFRQFKNYAEYNAGFSYMVDFTGGWVLNNVLLPSSPLAQSSQPPLSFCFDYSSQSGGNWYNANNISGVAGLLETETVAEYCARNNITRITRIYRSDNGADYSIYDKTTRLALNDLKMFSNWIIPKITWYYTDKNGNRKSGRDLTFWYPYTVSSVNIAVYEIRPTDPFQQLEYLTETENVENAPLYAMIAPPYYSTYDEDEMYTRMGNFRSGYVQTGWRSRDTAEITVHGRENPYVVFALNATHEYNTELSRDITAFDNIGHAFISGQYVLSDTDTRIELEMCAYPDAQSVIDYFADFGVTVSTDIDDVLSPPTDENIINPETPTEPIPSFPDNKTDETPIDPAYITPSTFGQSCIYTPHTLRDFMHWISDNTVSLENWKRLFVNPADVVQGINLFNLDLVAHDNNRVQNNAQTNILGVVSDIPNYSMLDGYNNIVDGGTLNLMAYYGNYADFTSMTYQCFIPFVGYISLRASDVVNRTLHLYYAVDFATGAAIAFLNSDNKMIYTAPCTVCGKIPLSISDKNSQLINNTLSVLGGIGGVIGGIAAGRPDKAVGAGMGAVGGIQLQTNYATRGSLSGVNIYKLLPAFVERTRFDLFLPSGEQQYLGSKFQSWAGAPSTQFAALKDCVDDNGYIECDIVVLPNCTATEQEKNEIRALIKSGIYI